jgi:hypothetical protein
MLGCFQDLSQTQKRLGCITKNDEPPADRRNLHKRLVGHVTTNVVPGLSRSMPSPETGYRIPICVSFSVFRIVTVGGFRAFEQRPICCHGMPSRPAR